MGRACIPPGRVTMHFPGTRTQECWVDGNRVYLTRMHTLMLERLLLSHPDRYVSMEELTEWLWPNPDLSPEANKECLRHFAWKLRDRGINVEARYGWGFRIPAENRGCHGMRSKSVDWIKIAA